MGNGESGERVGRSERDRHIVTIVPPLCMDENDGFCVEVVET